MWVEAAIDFPDEEVDFLGDRALATRLEFIRQRFAELAETARQGALLRDGLTIVIAGRPNAGKSSLLNRLAGYDAAIVTPVPGTTRDVLRERIEIDGLPLHVLDTAGLREAPDEVEAEGIRRAHREIARADRVLFVVDASDDECSRCRHRGGPRGAADRCAPHVGVQQDRPRRRRAAARGRATLSGSGSAPRPARASTCCAST